MKCSRCRSTLLKIDRREEMAELEEDATDGQLADHLAAELSGDRGAWNLGIIEYRCPKCGLVHQIQHDNLPDYRDLILAWRQKASEQDDYFSRFVFLYLAFIAHLRSNLFFEKTSDRQVLQALKCDQIRQARYADTIGADRRLLNGLRDLIRELKKRPLYNNSLDLDYPELDKWWNCSGLQPRTDDTSPKGVIRSADDWENIVEFWYGVRNNLFHGGNNPNVERDNFLVEYAYKTLQVFMDAELESY